MCGITGFVDPAADRPAVHLEALVRAMSDAMPHRGPDDEGQYVDPAQGLALAGQFGQAVGPGAGVRGAVELLPRGRILQPVVGAGVDDDGAGRQLRGDLGGGAVRKGQEHDVVSGQVFHPGVFEDAAGQTVEMGLQFP